MAEATNIKFGVQIDYRLNDSIEKNAKFSDKRGVTRPTFKFRVTYIEEITLNCGKLPYFCICLKMFPNLPVFVWAFFWDAF